MTSHNRAEMIVRNVQVWKFLQYFDEMVEAKDDRAIWIMNGFLWPKNLSVERHGNVLPLAQLMTTIGTLLVTFFVGRATKPHRWSGKMREPCDYDLRCGGPKCPESPTIHQVICAMRNALAHAFDDDGEPSVRFPERGVISFATAKGVVSRVTFLTEMGFVIFVRDYVNAIQRIVAEDAKAERTKAQQDVTRAP